MTHPDLTIEIEGIFRVTPIPIRLKHREEETGYIIKASFLPGDVIVEWDSDGLKSHISINHLAYRYEPTCVACGKVETHHDDQACEVADFENK